MGLVLDYARENGFDRVRYIGIWRGYQVYRMTSDSHRRSAFPSTMLILDGKARMADDHESLQILEKIG